ILTICTMLFSLFLIVYADGYPYDLVGRTYANTVISGSTTATTQSGVLSAYERTNGDKIVKARIWSREANVISALGGDWIYTTQAKVGVKDNGSNPIYFWIYDASPSPQTSTTLIPALFFDIISIFGVPTSVIGSICNGEYATVSHTDNTYSYDVTMANSSDFVMDLSNSIAWSNADTATNNTKSGASAEFLYNCSQTNYPVQFSGTVSYRLKTWIEGGYYRTYYADSAKMYINSTVN
ncbi:MAG: hypothetical protein WBL93_05310, partial [Lutisporaceae bacterium]